MDLEEKTLHSQEIFSGKIINLRVDTVLLPNGKESTREIVGHVGAVAMVVLDKEHNITLVRQYRKALERELLEIPAGGLEKGEDPEAAARRELEEETGIKADKWEKILDYYSAPGFCNEKLVLYLATGLQSGHANLDGDEFLEVIKMPLTDAYSLVKQGQIIDGKSIIGIQHAYFRILHGLS